MDAGDVTVRYGKVVLLEKVEQPAGGAFGVGRVEPVTVEQIHDLAEDVGVALVESPRLPGIDQIVGEIGVGVGPLVGDDIVDGKTVAEVDGSPVPSGIDGLRTRRIEGVASYTAFIRRSLPS